MTRIELDHLDARYKALQKSRSAAAELAFADWRRAANAFADERRSVDNVEVDLVEERLVPGALLGELEHLEELVDWSVGVGPAEEGDQVHAPIFEQEQQLHQSRFFTEETP